MLQHNDTLTASLDALHNTFVSVRIFRDFFVNTQNISHNHIYLKKNFSNSSGWQANEDDLEDFDADINMKPTQNAANNGKRHLNSKR